MSAGKPGKISTLGQQFMPITQLHSLKSGDFPSLKVKDVLDDGDDHLNQGYDLNSLRKHVADHGLKDPLMVKDGELQNGHHRAAVATEQGHMFVPHTDQMPSEWAPMDYRNKQSRPAVTRTWEPFLQEQESAVEAFKAEDAHKAQQAKEYPGQLQLFNDKRRRK